MLTQQLQEPARRLPLSAESGAEVVQHIATVMRRASEVRSVRARQGWEAIARLRSGGLHEAEMRGGTDSRRVWQSMTESAATVRTLRKAIARSAQGRRRGSCRVKGFDKNVCSQGDSAVGKYRKEVRACVVGERVGTSIGAALGLVVR